MRLTRRGKIVVALIIAACLYGLFKLPPDTPCDTATSVTFYEACR